MLVTEEQAREMWCPAARVIWAKRRETGEKGWITTGDVAFNRAQIERGAEEYILGYCIGSRCMWWRWEAGAQKSDCDGTVSVPNEQHTAGRLACGYCGMAGKPEVA